ncbi:hypothetical protein CRUP_010219, partial [Coryphaenoides rupestris]
MEFTSMDLALVWQLVLAIVWMQVGCIAERHDRYGAVTHLSMKDVLLFKDEIDPKCFSRTEYDFTCFFETADNKTYDFFYKTDEEKRCDVSVQRTFEGSFLHICIFPPEDIYMFVLTHLRVVEAGTNATLYTRSVSVEDQVLLDPPTNVTWHVDKAWESKVHYGIRYSSNRLQEKYKEGERQRVQTLTSLIPGEVLELQMRIHIIKYGLDETSGHWSHWSQPVATMVPQSADDISLECYTSDLQNITCQWHENIYEDVIYKLFYRLDPSESLGWTECLENRNLSDQCRFHGDDTQVVWVEIGVSSSPAPLDRIFYSDPFILNGSTPPGHLKERVNKGSLCLSWAAPLSALSAHLLYQVHYDTKEGGPWLMVSPKGPETSTCVEGLTGSRYSVQVRARPNGTIYSGQWSDWSLKLSGSIPSDIRALLMPCIPLLILIVATVFISLIPRYLSKLRKLLWPPIPNLDQVLQGFLTEMNGKTWDPPFTAKQYLEENPASVVEIMYTEDPVVGLEKPTTESTPLLMPERCFSAGEPADWNPNVALEVSQDY